MVCLRFDVRGRLFAFLHRKQSPHCLNWGLFSQHAAYSRKFDVSTLLGIADFRWIFMDRVKGVEFVALGTYVLERNY